MKKIFNVYRKMATSLHKGHLWLINQRRKQGKNVCLLIRDVEPNENQP